MSRFEICLTDGLTKVTPDWEPREREVHLRGWAGERVSFQVAWRSDSSQGMRHADLLKLQVGGAEVDCYSVELVPAHVPCWDSSEGEYLTRTPALLPDRLQPVAQGDDGVELQASHTGWHSLWVDVVLPASEVSVRGSVAGATVFEARVPVSVVPRELPSASIEVTQWFHSDTLALHYGVEVWSEQHWEAIGSQMRSARSLGATMLLTPFWTPPIDTAVGARRLTTQLLDITETSGRFEFGTERVDRWLDLLADSGLTGIEVPHLFTQWGANSAAPFVIDSGDGPQHRFGWDTPATAADYQVFLAQLVPFLRGYLADRIGEGNVVYHVSDEPTADHLDSYRAARDSVAGLLDGATVIDALSDPEFEELVGTPVVANDAIRRFREAGSEPDWVYYCVAQHRNVANRLIAQTGVWTRALGWQMYKARAKGFLHWGFNFYGTQLSRGLVDPFRDASAGGGFTSGDPFIVYPGPGFSTLESIRHRMFRQGLDDLAVAEQAEALVGREAVLRVIDPDGDLDYDSGWVSGDEWLRRRAELDELCLDALGGTPRK